VVALNRYLSLYLSKAADVSFLSVTSGCSNQCLTLAMLALNHYLSLYLSKAADVSFLSVTSGSSNQYLTSRGGS
jgi:hypothetical protein